ncbi:hypothetical protein NIES23_47210 [Trichormus variabilis NIES-23]|uniref:Uncharacterized protein n=1 Tax=Trichormus variabilis NIES-23 TaxID=1973479 RepID=A0A1Z4KSD7_ANAVA|nr:hypothetical protein NIES23_47210 [Trichormus variabilis NIES-23]
MGVLAKNFRFLIIVNLILNNLPDTHTCLGETAIVEQGDCTVGAAESLINEDFEVSNLIFFELAFLLTDGV